MEILNSYNVENKTGHKGQGYTPYHPGFRFTTLPAAFLAKQNIPAIHLWGWRANGRGQYTIGYLVPAVTLKGLEQVYTARQLPKRKKEWEQRAQEVANIQQEIATKKTKHRLWRLENAIALEEYAKKAMDEAFEAKELLKKPEVI